MYTENQIKILSTLLNQPTKEYYLSELSFIVDKKPAVVISGRFGPKAFRALETAGIEAYVAHNGNVEEVLKAFEAGKLTQVDAATGSELHGG